MEDLLRDVRKQIDTLRDDLKEIARKQKEQENPPARFDFMKGRKTDEDIEFSPDIDLLDDYSNRAMKEFKMPFHERDEEKPAPAVVPRRTDDELPTQRSGRRVRRGRVTICMDIDIWKKFKHHAFRKNKKYSHLLEEMITKHIEQV